MTNDKITIDKTDNCYLIIWEYQEQFSPWNYKRECFIAYDSGRVADIVKMIFAPFPAFHETRNGPV